MSLTSILQRLFILCLPPIIPKAWGRIAPHGRMSFENQQLYQDFIQRNSQAKVNEFVLRDNIALTIHPDCKVGLEYFCFSCIEMVDELDSFLALTANCTALLDIGALHGIFSLAFTKSNPGSRVALAVDASPLAFSKLLYNVYKNPDCNIAPVEYAVSKSAGFIDMAYEWEHAIACTQQFKGDAFLPVPSITGDLLCEEKCFSPDVIKIDVEGHEIDVLWGLEDTLMRMRPLVFIEVHPSRIAAAGRNMQELWHCIEKHFYTAQRSKGSLVSETDFLAFDVDIRLILTPKAVPL